MRKYNKIMRDSTGAHFMREAYELAVEARKLDEVPVGAIVTRGNQIIGRGFNQTRTFGDPTAHAEIIALRDAAKTIGNFRLVGTDMFVTTEPCTMCAGALVHARIRKLHFATLEPRSGAVISTPRVLDNSSLNHHVMYQHGLYAEQCASLMRDFFSAKR